MPDLLKEFGELNAFRAAEQTRLSAVPEKPDGYKAELPTDFNAGEGFTFEIDPKHPMWEIGREVAHRLNLSQDQFSQLAGAYAMLQVTEQRAMAGFREEQLQSLGPKWQERTKAIETFLSSKVGPKFAEEFGRVAVSAELVNGIGKLIEMAQRGGVRGVPAAGAPTERGVSDEDWNKMGSTDRLLAGINLSAGQRRG